MPSMYNCIQLSAFGDEKEKKGTNWLYVYRLTIGLAYRHEHSCSPDGKPIDKYVFTKNTMKSEHSLKKKIENSETFSLNMTRSLQDI